MKVDQLLTLIQSELKAPKNQFNAFGKYNYRSCEDILEALKPLLLKYECTLTVNDQVKEMGGMMYIESTATIEKDGFSKFVCAQAGIDPNRKGMDIAQCFGSSSSYARKYALNGLFLIDDTKDPDSTNDHAARQPKKEEKISKQLAEKNQVKNTTDVEYVQHKDLPDFPEEKWEDVAIWIAQNKSLRLAGILKKIESSYKLTSEIKSRIASQLQTV